jgi:hypothetical protein
MAIKRINLTRDQLATFLKNHEQIKQFEQLFAVADAIAPDVVNEVKIEAASAQAAATQALGQIEALSQESATNASVADIKATQALNQVAYLAQEAAISAASAENKANQALALLGKLSDAVEAVQMTPAKVPIHRTRFGSFYDTTSQTAALANTAYPITYNTTNLTNGVFLRGSSTSEIEIDTEGVYNIQFSVQLDKTSGGTGNFWIWPRINGVDVSNSASQVQIQGNDAEIFSAANFFFDLKAGDYVQIMWAVSDVSVQLAAFASDTFRPAIPSIIVTVSNNIRSYPA